MGAHKPWFRFHVVTLDDPKVQRLPGELFKAWVNLLCIAAKNDGKIPGLADAAYGLRLKEHSAAALIAKLAVAGLLDRVDDGYYEPRNWNQWQYRADHSTERVRLHRDRKRALAFPERAETKLEITPAERDETVSCNSRKPFHETDQSISQHIRTDGDEEEPGASPATSEIDSRAKALTKEIAILAGFAPRRLPSGWKDAHHRVQQWMDGGWPEHFIRTSVRLQCENAHRSTPKYVQYFERGIAEYVARQRTPLPEAAVPSARKVRANHAQYDPKSDPRSGLGAIRRLREQLEMQPGGSDSPDGGPVRLLPPGSLHES